MLTTAVAIVASWIAAYALWLTQLAFRGPMGELDRGVVNAALFLGMPLAIVTPSVHVPILRWLSRRGTGGWSRRVVVVTTSAMLTLPLVLWPVLVFGDGIGDFSLGVKDYWILYVGFGTVFGAWYASLRRPPR